LKKILVINTKGGVGKTTASIELFAPFLYLRNKAEKVKVFSFDEENFLNNFYENSQLLEISSRKVSSADMEDEISSLLLKNHPMVLDIGANKTTTYMLKSLENTGLFHVLDLIAIPITDGEQDVLNAKSIYNSIKRMSKDIPIIFILSRYVEGRDVAIQFESFFESLYSILEPKDSKYIKMLDSDSIKFSRKMSKTIYEMSLDANDFDKEFKEALASGKDEEFLMSISKKRRIYKLAKSYRVNVLNDAFEIIDSLDI
jgi:hypothetical protein